MAVALAIWLLVGIEPDKTGPLALPGWAAETSGVATIESNQLKEAIDLSAGYLIRRCNENGKFVYRVNVNPAIQPRPDIISCGMPAQSMPWQVMTGL